MEHRGVCWSLKLVPGLRVLHASQGNPCIFPHSLQISDYQGISLRSPSREPVGHHGKILKLKSEKNWALIQPLPLSEPRKPGEVTQTL